MTEEDARERVRELTSGDAIDRLTRLCDVIVMENRSQNLIARSTEAAIWARHVLDSVQLLPLAADRSGCWLDIGTGGGFPGLVIAAADIERPMVLVEPRRLRAGFLRNAAAELGLRHVTVRQARIEAVKDVRAAVISARAVAPVEALLAGARGCATFRTRWLLLRGRDDVARLSAKPGMFHVKQSLSQDGAGVVIVDGMGA